MISAWMLYLCGVALLLALSAWAAERAAMALALPLRWLWVGALAGSLLLPLVVALAPAVMPRSGPEAVVLIGEASVLEMDVAEASGALPWPAPNIPALDAPLLWGWALASLLLFAYLLLSAQRLRQQRRGWRPMCAGSREYLLAPDSGPAVVGLWRSVIVLPSWALELDAERRELLLRHEEEHLRAGDPRLLLFALALLVLFPWNLPLWWQAHRLRLALEIDCDARVLRASRAARAYGSLLLHVGARNSGGGFAVASFSASHSFLERRLRMITRDLSRPAWPALLVALPVVAAGLFVACDLTQPATEAPLDATAPDAAVTPAPHAGADIAQEPAFSPRDVEPALGNPQAFGRALEQAYPAALKDASIGGTTVLWVYVDEHGEVGNVRIQETSGYPSLDAAAETVIREAAEFTPALNQGQPVPVWIALPVTFQVDPTLAAAASSRAREAAPEQPLGARPSGPDPATLSSHPRIVNRDELGHEIDRHYPKELRDAGIGGTTMLWMHVDATGQVTEATTQTSSGYETLDRAAEAAIRYAEFTPAMNDGSPTEVWIAIPVTFAPWGWAIHGMGGAVRNGPG